MALPSEEIKEKINIVGVAIFILLIFFFSLSTKVSALLIPECSDINYVYNQSPVVVFGEVTKIESPGDSYTYIEVQVEKYLKGKRDSLIRIKQWGGKTAGNQILWVEDAPEFKIGERGYLYLTTRSDGSSYSTVCGRGVTNEFPSSTTFARVLPAMNRLKMLSQRPIVVLALAVLGSGVTVMIYLLRKK